MQVTYDKGYPLKVFEDAPDHFLLVDGRHRFCAASKRGFKEVPCVVLKASGLEHERLRAVLMCAANGTSNPYVSVTGFFNFLSLVILRSRTSILRSFLV
jgi:hypothetical protein